MHQIAIRVFHLLSPSERRQLWKVGFAVVVMAIFEVAGVASIAPFVAIVTDRSIIVRNGSLAYLYRVLDFQSSDSFIIFVGLAALAIVVLANTCSALANWTLLNYSHHKMHALSSRLLQGYLSQPYAFFLSRNGADLLKNVLAEVSRVVGNIILPLVFVAARLLVAVFLILLLLWADPRLALTITAVIGGAYGLIYGAARRWLMKIGYKSVEKAGLRYRLASEALEGIREIKFAGVERSMQQRYERESELASRYEVRGQAVATLPRYALEAIAFGAVILMVIYLLHSGRDVGTALPLVAMYALSGYRLLPAAQNIYAALTQIRFNARALDVVEADMRAVSNAVAFAAESPRPIGVTDVVELRDVSFKYDGRSEPVLDKVSLKIPARTTIGIVGSSGAGKTTLADIILSLQTPTAGDLLVDGRVIDARNARDWRAGLGYVPQSIYLTDGTIIENITFGFDPADVDMEAVERAARAANLHDFIVNELPDGYRTGVGDHGVRLSGGQRQRIAIARALYRDPQMLVLDEATSSLDSVTEDIVMDAIRTFSHHKTMLVIAHRLSTLTECDRIYVLSGGKVAAEGSYAELLETSGDFRALARAGLARGSLLAVADS
jgi:ABC-type multidrug transport system fused ATPase/permease subunit